ncbi:hypothetical protein CKO15_08625 [Halorhodospira abdelmalekii]|uniref:fluoride efflux transporter FluC n=1 Tax=Halorhodospira abdelmalekii TaxID=421629 RepID=UPI00237B501D|nr:CrcB family protein [Halorhodospira abdelmalekii]MBK1735345.1 hypothetical protein [Halorhodospira abdelmalekii]
MSATKSGQSPSSSLSLSAALWVGAGSALGGMSRFALDGLLIRAGVTDFPWGTLAANALGSWLIGVIVAVTLCSRRAPLPAAFHPFAVAGFCGGLTTFSAFSLQSLQLIERSPLLAVVNIAATLLISLLAVAYGYRQGQRWGRRRARAV